MAVASTHTRPPLARAATIAKYIALGMVALLVVVAISVAVMPDSVWKHLIVRVVSREAGRQASIDGDVRVHILRLEPEFAVEGFRLANADWVSDRPMLAVRRVDVRLSLLALLRLRLEFRACRSRGRTSILSVMPATGPIGISPRRVLASP